MSAMSLSFICHPAAGLHTSSSSESSATSFTPTRGLKRAREEAELSEVVVIDLTTPEVEEEGPRTKRRRADPEPAVVRARPYYGGLGLGHPSTSRRRADPLRANQPPRHPVWKTESALQGRASPTSTTSSPRASPAPDLITLPSFASLLRGDDFTQYPLAGAGIGLGFTVELAPLVIHPDEM